MLTLPLTANHIRLRDPRPDDMDDFARWMMPGAQWTTLDAPYYHVHDTEADLQAHVEKIRTHLQSNPDLPQTRHRVVIARRADDEFMGWVTRAWVSEVTNWIEVGIVIFDPAHWGRGYGYEALGLWSDYLFASEFEFARLDLRTWSGNSGMMALAEKLGYSLEARFRKARIVDGVYYDGIGYGILRDEWQQCYPQGFAASLATE